MQREREPSDTMSISSGRTAGESPFKGDNRLDICIPALVPEDSSDSSAASPECMKLRKISRLHHSATKEFHLPKIGSPLLGLKQCLAATVTSFDD